ncbi:hypothetical protein RclHR1_01220030 [Rhizophagus clarus]|uniref:CCHC-type domain-containing protein n=1 Tax=Rhizophagus clarus TaxID=94130 RepID=A0A2Z6QLL6_9GLOM|nr:hypothetical protein RclHR1_01220030 [Rhizophagus clarus]
MDRIVGDLQQLWANAQSQVNRMINNTARKQARIGALVQENFALRLLYQRNAYHLQRSRRDIGLLEYNQDRLYERYEKWKNKTQVERQNILNLQGQIFALQNNLPNIQQIKMVGYEPPIFYGRPGEDPEDWLRDMQRYIITSRINIAPDTGVVNLTAVKTLAARNGGGQIGGLNTAGEFQDWSIAGGKPVDIAPVAPNAGGGLPAVTIAPGIKLSQLLYLFRTAYTTGEHLKQTAVFGQLMQGDMSVEQFSAQIKKVGKLAEMTPKQQREQFIHGLNPMNQYNIQMMVKFYDTQDNITKALAEAEKYTLSQMNASSSIPVFLAANPYVDTNRSGGGMTKNEIEDLIKTTMASSQPQQNNSKKLANKRGEDLIIRRFLSELLRGRGNSAPSDDYNYDPIDDITDSMASMILNSATINAIKSAVRSAVKKCTKCSRFGHTSRKCSVKKKRKSKKSKKSKVNLAIELDSDSDSSSNDTSSSDNSDFDTSSSDSSDSNNDLNVHIAKSKKNELKLIFPSHFFQDSSLIAPKQIVPIQEKIVSCFSASDQNDVSTSTKDSDESSLEKESLDDPMEIYFVQKKEPETSVATVKCKIKRLKIPAMTLDSRAEPPIITENIVERIRVKIDKYEIHDLEGISTILVESIGVVRNLPITLAPKLTIIEDFIIMRYRKPTLIFSNKLLKKYGCAVDWSTEELKIPFNGKDYIIPVTMYKVKNKFEVNCAVSIANNDSSPLDCISQELGVDETLKKK